MPYSRYLLRCEALCDPDGDEVRRILDSAFLEFGLPAAIRSDGGPPFASSGPARMTALSVWILQLGIRVEIIAPGKPQQNGRLERLHRTLQEETASSPAANCRAQQRLFDPWRREYNHERPHEALSMDRPATVYTRSSRSYPRRLVKVEFNPFSLGRTHRQERLIKWHRRKVFVSSALKCEYGADLIHRHTPVSGAAEMAYTLGVDRGHGCPLRRCSEPKRWLTGGRETGWHALDGDVSDA
jgi:putative transposase